jgi:hypothetical protein
VNRTAPAARQILSYFVRNPSAADSLEGIAKWRLLEEAIHRNVVETKEALEWLVERGYLIEIAQPHAGRLFQLNTEKRTDAKSFLDAATEPEPRGFGDRPEERG